MAGDWIKMRSDLQSHPKVVRIASALKADRLRTVGGLHAVWSLFDMHSADGRLDGYTPAALDDLIGWPGFAEALASVDWLVVGEDFLALPRFDAHNGQSAKRRAQEMDRKREVRKASASDADKKRTREREEKEKKEDKSSFPAPTPEAQEDERLARWMFGLITEAMPGTKEPNFSKWANTIRLMRERDHLTLHRIAEVFLWANRDAFWRLNILSPDKLREKFPQLAAKRDQEPPQSTSRGNVLSKMQDRSWAEGLPTGA